MWTIVYCVKSLSVKDILYIRSGLHANVIMVIFTVFVIRFSTFTIGRAYVRVCVTEKVYHKVNVCVTNIAYLC